MEIDAQTCFESTYGRWIRNHPAQNEKGVLVNRYVMQLAVALLWEKHPQASELILENAKRDLGLNDIQTSKLMSQAELISRQTTEMQDRLKESVTPGKRSPEYVIRPDHDPFYGVGGTNPSRFENLWDGLGRVNLGPRRHVYSRIRLQY